MKGGRGGRQERRVSLAPGELTPRHARCEGRGGKGEVGWRTVAGLAAASQRIRWGEGDRVGGGGWKTLPPTGGTALFDGHARLHGRTPRMQPPSPSVFPPHCPSEEGHRNPAVARGEHRGGGGKSRGAVGGQGRMGWGGGMMSSSRCERRRPRRPFRADATAWYRLGAAKADVQAPTVRKRRRRGVPSVWVRPVGAAVATVPRPRGACEYRAVRGGREGGATLWPPALSGSHPHPINGCARAFFNW